MFKTTNFHFKYIIKLYIIVNFYVFHNKMNEINKQYQYKTHSIHLKFL